jgi:putative heme-binding domain-containing protein
MAEDFNDMGSPTDKPGDRIDCIYPDGKIKVFATNLYAVFGIEYIDGKVYVHHTPKFSVFDDDNGVGKNRRDLIESDNPHPWLPSFNDHIPSGFHEAMDGYFYVSTGDKGILGAVGTDGSKIEMRGGVFRMRPDGSKLEVYCTGTRNHLDVAINAEDEMFTYDNTDDGGGWWTRLTHMVDGGYYGYPYDFKPQKPYTLWMIRDFGSGAPTVTLCYNEDALPQEYRGNMFICEWAGAELLRFKLKRTGSTYDLEQRVQYEGNQILTNFSQPRTDVDFVTRGGYGVSFRPVGICVTPDGMGFYVTDWGLSGWKNGQVLGHLFKITYTGKSLAAPKPSWYIPAATGKKFSASTAELVKALSHPSRNVRMVAQRRLADRGQAAEGKLAALLGKTSAPSYARWSAIWALDAIDGGKGKRGAIVAALKDKDPTVQAQAARQLGTRQAKEAVRPLIGMLDSTNAMLRFRAATALGRIGDGAAVMPLRVALAQKDLFARYAAFKALNRMGQANPKTWPQIVDALASVRPEIREAAFFATRETYDVGLVTALAEFLKRPTIPTEPRTNVLNLLASLYFKQPQWNGDWWNTTPVYGAPAPKTVSWEGSPVVASAMRGALEDTAPAMRQIAFEWVRATHDTNQASMLRTMYNHETDVTLRAGILRALPGGNDTNSRALIDPILKNVQSPMPLLEAAVELAEKINSPDVNAELIGLAAVNPHESVQKALYQGFGKNKVVDAVPLIGLSLACSNYGVRLAAVGALTSIGGDAAIAQFMNGLDDDTLDVRTQSVDALGTLKAKQAVPRLIQLSTNKNLGTPAIQALTQIKDLAALDVYLNGLASKNAGVRAQCKTALTSLADAALPKIEAKLTPSNSLPDDTIAGLHQIYQTNPAAKKGPLFKLKFKQTPIGDYQSFALANQGDAAAGKKIFADVNGVYCIRCHRMDGVGAQVGPELTGIGNRQSRAQIIESVLYPSKLILDGYQQVLFSMKDDEDYAGIVRTETPDTVTIIDNLGKTNVLQKANIKTRKISQISLMPDGLQAGLSLAEFSDLIGYVEASKQGGPAPVPPRRPTPPVAQMPHPVPPPTAAIGHRPPPVRKEVDPLEWPAPPFDLADPDAATTSSPTPPPNPYAPAVPPPTPSAPVVRTQTPVPPPIPAHAGPPIHVQLPPAPPGFKNGPPPPPAPPAPPP